MATLYELPRYNDGANPVVDFSTEEHGGVVIEKTPDGDFILRAKRENVDVDTIADILNDVATHDEFDDEAAEIAFGILADAKEDESKESDEDEREDAEEKDVGESQDGENTTIELPDTDETIEKGERLHYTELNCDSVILGELAHSRVSIRPGSNDPEKWLKQDVRDKLLNGTLQRVSEGDS